MKVSDLNAADYNPRVITAQEKARLKASMEEHGDLSGVTVNVRDGKNVIITGHQRISTIRGKKTRIIKEAVEKNAQGTVAIGRIEVKEANGTTTTIPYREVSWTRQREMACNVAANAAGGNFDQEKLGAVIAELKKGKMDIEAHTCMSSFEIAAATRKLEASKAPAGSKEKADTGTGSFSVIDPNKVRQEAHAKGGLTCPSCGFLITH